MERLNRKPLQGITNIIRFNWHFYAVALGLLAALAFMQPFLPGELVATVTLFMVLAFLGMVVSLAVSWYVYDQSPLYSLNWMDDLPTKPGMNLVNIHAGFDETSALLQQKYPQANWQVFDFYDPVKHTEVSIKRARKAYPVFTGTQSISTQVVPLASASVDGIFLLLSAHEIRNPAERILFFTQLQVSLRPDGKVIVVEHLRDAYNFAAYTIGFFHFYPRSVWRKTFAQSGLTEVKETKITPFISVFILQKNDFAP